MRHTFIFIFFYLSGQIYKICIYISDPQNELLSFGWPYRCATQDDMPYVVLQQVDLGVQYSPTAIY